VTSLKASGSGTTSTSGSCGRSTGCTPLSCWERTSCSFWAGSRVDLTAGRVEGTTWQGPGPEDVVVERVRVIQVAVRRARAAQAHQLEGAELVPGLRVLRLEVDGLPVQRQRLRVPLDQSLREDRVNRQRIERTRRQRICS